MTFAALATLSAAQVRADFAPYAVDANTLHLWHLNELAGPAADEAHYNYAGTFTTKPDSNQPLTALFGGAALGTPSVAGFGNAVNIGANGAGFAALTPANSTADNVDHTFDNPTTHAFTMEAVIQIGFNPTVAITTPQEIIAGEGDAGDSSDRSWQFRLQPNTTPGTTPWVLRFQKVSGFGGVGGSTANYNLDANIPNTGIDAIQQNGWYHVAATYNGNLTDPSSLKLYWTKLDSANSVAAQIGSGNMNGWLRQQDTDFSLGNELRDFNGNTEGFFGAIDEVRISDIERAPNQFIFIPSASTRFWNVAGSGNWDTATNWTGNTVPNGVAAIASFGGGGTPLGSNASVTINGTKTLGAMNFDNSSFNFTLANGAAGAISLDNAALPASVSVTTGSHAINVPVTIGANGATFSIAGGSSVLSLGGDLSGGAITKTGAGKIIFTANSTASSLAVSGGTFQVGNGGSTGSIGSAPVTLTNGGVLAYNKTGAVAVSNSITATSGFIQQDGAGVMTLNGTNSFGAQGGVIANAGTIKAGNAAAILGGGVIVNNGGIVDMNGFDAGGGILSGNGGTVTDNGTTAGTSTFTVGGTSAGDFFGNLNNGPTRTIKLVKTGTGSVKLRSANSFSGGTTLNQGFIDVYNSAALGSGAIVINPGTTVPTVGAEAARITLDSGVNLANPITMTTSNSGVATGSIQAFDNAFASVDGPISILGNAITGGHFQGPITSGQLSVNGVITAGPAVTAIIIRQGNMRFTATGSSYPELQVRAGNTELGAANALATNAVIDIGGNASATVAAVVEMAGFDQRIAGLKNAITPANAALITSSIGAPTLTLDVGAGNTQTYGGAIGGSIKLVVKSGTQVLTKTGTSAINGVFDHSGGTVVDGGTLQLNAPAWAVGTGGNGVDVQHGSLVFDYTGSTTPASTVYPILDGSFDTGFATGTIHSSTATSARGLGYKDDAASSKFIVTYTLFGDTNLDLTVNFDDLLSLAQAYGSTTANWTMGDSNYDQAATFDDLLSLAQNYGLTTLANGEILIDDQMHNAFAADWARAQLLAPEPTTLGLIGGLAAISMRRRRAI